jgi:hypothetical protein
MVVLWLVDQLHIYIAKQAGKMNLHLLIKNLIYRMACLRTYQHIVTKLRSIEFL